MTALWWDLCGLFCDIPQALRNAQPGLTSDMADACCCDDSIALAGTVGTWKQWIIYCARRITCNETQYPCQAEQEILHEGSSSTLCGPVIHLSKATNYETTSLVSPSEQRGRHSDSS